MRRVVVFILLSGAALVAFLLTAVWYLSRYQSSSTSMAGMMGQMMGNQYAGGLTSPMPTYVWAVLAALIVLLVGGIAGMGYYLTFPEIRTVPPAAEQPQPQRSAESSAKADWSVLIRTSNPEEKKVLEVLASHDGSYLQKFIVKESGLSRLKTHRIVSRFAERGIVSVTRSGNTNQVSLAPWLKQDAALRKQAP